MGYGDDLLITSLASKIKKKYPDRQIVIGIAKKNVAYHSPIYDNNPNISDCRNLDNNKPVHLIDFHQFNRPYIDYEKSTEDKQVFRKFKPIPGEIYFSEKELSKGNKIIDDAIKYWSKQKTKKYKSIIFLETSSTKIDNEQFSIKHFNKDWGYSNWKKLVDKIKNEYLIIQIVHEKTKIIEGIYHTKKMSFRIACAVLNGADMYVGPEGGFGHVAAALKKQAVIYFGGWNSPNDIGYDGHHHVYFENQLSPCGELKKICQHCNEAREKISVEHFLKYIKKISL